MSTAYAIAAVTAVLRSHLTNALIEQGVSSVLGSVAVSALPPDRVIAPGGEEPTQINLFLHQVSHNQGWRNSGLPARDGSGARVSAPPLALNLHYLVTVYGKELYAPEILLGHAMQVFHENPVLSRDAIRRALSPTLPDPTLPGEVAAAQLAEQMEQLKITPEALNTEEMSRLWSALQAQYRATAAYQVSVVLIEGRQRVRPSLPVTSSGIRAVSLDLPVIASAEPAEGPGKPITAQSTLILRGRRLRGAATTSLRVGSAVVALPEPAIREDRLTLDLSSVPEGLRAGTLALQVLHTSGPDDPPGAFSSNTTSVTLRPVIVPEADSTGSKTVGGITYREGTMTVGVTPPVTRNQKVVLLLNETPPPAGRPARGYAIALPPGNGIAEGEEETDTLVIPYADIAAGAYLVRLEVDGAGSALETDAEGAFSGPRETV
jgi:Pvc16 N-terminal domain